jgi:Na+-transporting methylmalonyl-CoA/oxaloacetate decarboxylase gamma subunit
MLVGMGTVFSFLTMLVLGMLAMSAIVTKLTPSAGGDDISEEEIAAITAAIARHRNRTSR